MIMILPVLKYTIKIIGSLGIQGEDKCGFSDVHVGTFDVSSGVLIVLLVFLTILVMVLYTGHCVYLEGRCLLIMLFPIVVLVVVCVLGIAANVLFSFISIVEVVYRDYNMWRPENIDCTSPAFYSAFTYVTIELVFIGVLIICVVIVLCYCRQRYCTTS